VGLSNVVEDLEKRGKLADRKCPAMNELLAKKD
jgi:hypothetical protein